MWRFDEGSGRLEAAPAGLRNGTVRISGTGFLLDSTRERWTRRGDSYTASRGDLTVRIEMRGDRLRFAFENRSDRDEFLDGFDLSFPPSMDAADWMELIHSQSFAERTGVKRVGLPTRSLSANPSSSMVYALQCRSRAEALVFSAFPPHEGDYLRFSARHEAAHCEGRFGVRIFSEQDRRIPAGASVVSSWIRIQTGPDAGDLLEAAGRDWAAVRTRAPKPLCRGWNSWDYYAGAVSQKDVMENLTAGRILLGDHLRHIVIDEGWEPRWGAWVANWKFPEGLGYLCDAIQKGGAHAGIWTAPLLVNAYTDLYREHPDWFARDKAGQGVILSLSYGPMALLDPTHPDAVRWLSDVFRRLRTYGFDLFKVDFTQELLKARKFHDMTLGRAGILRRAFTVIREAIGDDAYLLGCGAPFEAVTGLVDSVRVTGDIHTHWGHVVANFEAMSGRWWMSGRLWNVDPDFLIVRCSETTEDRQLNREQALKPHDPVDYWMAGRDMNLEEVRTLALMIYLGGGDLVLGDALPKLNETGRNMIRRIFDAPPVRTAARPLDLFERHETPPTRLLAREAWGCALGVFNWSEDPVEVVVHPASYGLPETGEMEAFWSAEKIPYSGAIRFTLPPRSSKGWLFRISSHDGVHS